MKTKRLPKLLKITNCTILDPFSKNEFTGEILLKNGRIEAVSKKISSENAKEIDADGGSCNSRFL